MATQKFAYAVLIFGLLSACGSDMPSGSGGAGGGSGGSGGSSGSGGSGGSGGMVPGMITISGVASEATLSGRTPLAGVTIGAYRENSNTPVATTTSDAMGKYSLTITTNGNALDGYLLGQKSGYKDNYLYPPAPLAADTANIPILMLTQGNFDLAATLAGVNQTAQQAFIGIQLYDGAMMPVQGATITSSPAGTVRYNHSGVPDSHATSSDTDGIGYVFAVAPGIITLNASKSGINFHPHNVNARADAVTTTIVQP